MSAVSAAWAAITDAAIYGCVDRGCGHPLRDTHYYANTSRPAGKFTTSPCAGDSDLISTLAGFRRHLVGKTLINVFHCDIAEMRFAGKLVII